jgi:probable phosphoglycerate mutase
MKLLIIRHGDPDYSIDSLTEKGWREAELLSDRLAGLAIRDIYCSPLGRAIDTASLTLKKMRREATILSWLTEFRGKVVDPCSADKKISWNFMPQYWTRCPELFDKDRWLDHDLIQTDNVRQIYDETVSGITELLNKYGYRQDGYLWHCASNTDETLVLFCHCAIGQVIMGYLLGIAAPVMWHSFVLPASSVTTLITEERAKGTVFFRCMQMGDTSHLYAAGEPISSAGLYPECCAK